MGLTISLYAVMLICGYIGKFKSEFTEEELYKILPWLVALLAIGVILEIF